MFALALFTLLLGLCTARAEPDEGLRRFAVGAVSELGEYQTYRDLPYESSYLWHAGLSTELIRPSFAWRPSPDWELESTLWFDLGRIHDWKSSFSLGEATTQLWWAWPLSGNQELRLGLGIGLDWWAIDFVEDDPEYFLDLGLYGRGGIGFRHRLGRSLSVEPRLRPSWGRSWVGGYVDPASGASLDRSVEVHRALSFELCFQTQWGAPVGAKQPAEEAR